MHCTILPRSGTRGRKAAEWTGFSLPPWTLEKWNRVSQGGRRFDKPEFARYKGNLALLTLSRLLGRCGARPPPPDFRLRRYALSLRAGLFSLMLQIQSGEALVAARG